MPQHPQRDEGEEDEAGHSILCIQVHLQVHVRQLLLEVLHDLTLDDDERDERDELDSIL